MAQTELQWREAHSPVELTNRFIIYINFTETKACFTETFHTIMLISILNLPLAAPDKVTAVAPIATGEESPSKFSQFFSLPDGTWAFNWFNKVADEKSSAARNLERNKEKVKFLTEQKEEKEKRIENLQNKAQQMRTALEEERRKREKAQKEKEILENGIHQEKEEKGEKLK